MELFDQHNITVVYVAKFLRDSANEEEYLKEFTLMKNRDPRIILSHALSATTMVCWLHRMGMIGARYVFLTLFWIEFDPADIKILDHWQWCSKD